MSLRLLEIWLSGRVRVSRVECFRDPSCYFVVGARIVFASLEDYWDCLGGYLCGTMIVWGVAFDATPLRLYELPAIRKFGCSRKLAA